MSEIKKLKTRGLGRGLNALFDDEEDAGFSSALGDDSAVFVSSKGGQRLGVEQLSPSAVQPRMDFDQEALQQLADSIQVHGVLQPILVRQKRDLITNEFVEGQYEIIAGERRWRASQLAQVHDVPVVIREFDDAQAMQIALIENLQREDLNPVEEALGYQRLMDEHEYTQVKLAELLGRSRSHIANMTRMLSLQEEILGMVRHGDLSPGHARALITLKDPKPLAKKIVAEGMSVRAVEAYLNKAAGKKPSGSSSKGAIKVHQKCADTLAAEHELSTFLGMNLEIESKDLTKGGYVRVDFKSLDQLNNILDLLRDRHVPPYGEVEVKRLMD